MMLHCYLHGFRVALYQLAGVDWCLTNLAWSLYHGTPPLWTSLLFVTLMKVPEESHLAPSWTCQRSHHVWNWVWST